MTQLTLLLLSRAPQPMRVALALLALCVAALGLPVLALAQGAFVDPAAIDRDVLAFTGHPIGTAGGAALPVDRRLKLVPCRSPLALSWRGNRHDTVVVECPDPGSWRLFVPLRMAETAGVVAVMRGEAVTVIVSGDGFAVTQPGEAMDSGAVGDWIRVRGIKDGTPKGDPIRARITRPGEVAVPIGE